MEKKQGPSPKKKQLVSDTSQTQKTIVAMPQLANLVTCTVCISPEESIVNLALIAAIRTTRRNSQAGNFEGGQILFFSDNDGPPIATWEFDVEKYWQQTWDQLRDLVIVRF